MTAVDKGIRCPATRPNGGKAGGRIRRPPAGTRGFKADALTESFGISPDGTRIMTAGLRETRSLMLAEGLRGVK